MSYTKSADNDEGITDETIDSYTEVSKDNEAFKDTIYHSEIGNTRL